MVKELKETKAPGAATQELCEGLGKLGHNATRTAGPNGSILECRLVNGTWHYFIAGEFVQVPNQPDPGLKEFVMYAEPGEFTV